MDFHSLARRELQALCKKNKIPANITNAAMANALKALEIVEGLEEFLNQLESNPLQNLEKSAPRTTTRRKPTTNAAPQSLARPIRSARKLVTEVLSQENKDRNIPSTPALPTGRKKGPAGSTRRKVESQIEETTVQHAYSTRRSVRLLEKGMDQLSLDEEKGRVEAVKMDTLDDVEEKNEYTTEVKHDDELENETEKTEVADQTFVVALDVKGKTYITFVSNDLSSENSDNVTDAIIDEKVADEVTKDTEVEKLDFNVNVEQETEGSPAQVLDTESTLKLEVDSLICQEDLADANLKTTRDTKIVLAEGELVDVKDVALIETPSEEESNNEEDTEVIEKFIHVNEGPQLEFSAEKARGEEYESSDENSSEEDSDIDDETESDQEESNNEEDTEVIEEIIHVNEGPQLEFSTEKARDEEYESSDENSSEEDNDIDDETEKARDEIIHVNEGPQLEFSTEKARDEEYESSDENSSEEDNDIDDETEKARDEIIHVNEGPQLEFSTEKARDEEYESSDENSSEEDNDIDDETESDQEDILSEGHLDTNIKQSEDESEEMETETEEDDKSEDGELVDESNISSATATENSAAGKTEVTSPKCSSNKKQMLPVSELNKENIDNAEPKKDEVKENTKTGTNKDSLTENSLRQLTKMLKAKLIITNQAKNAEGKNVTEDPAGMTRVALEKLPENHMPTAGE